MSSKQESLLDIYLFPAAKLVSLILAIVSTVWTFVLWLDNSKNGASSFRDNVVIEIAVGGFFLFWTLFLSLLVGEKYLKKKQFYRNIIPVLQKIKSERESGNIEEESARSLVMEIADSFGREILIPDLIELNLRGPDDKCNVCYLEVKLNSSKKHCANCHLDCFLWKDI
jgi:hypothetical protein